MEEKVKHPIIVITGPTASGKTSLSLELAKEFNGEIICADSMTVYKGMDIGTDKPSAIQNSKFRIQNEPHPVIPDSTSVIPAKAGIQSPSNIDSRLRGNDKNESRNDATSGSEMTIQGIPHHMIDIKNPDEEFNVSIFKDLAEKKIKEIHTRGNIPFLVGGSTMYIDALVYKYDIPSAKPNLKLRAELEKESNDELFEQLVELDPDAQVAVDKNNKRRLIRALEVCIQTGKPFTKQKKKQELPKNVLYLALLPSSVIPATRPAKPWRSWKAGIQKKEIDSGQARMTKEIGRQELYQKINKRVDEMLAEGFLDEVKKLYKKYDLNTAMQATGYRQLVEYLEGNLTLEEAVEKTKQSHRNYAKRQLTWLRRNPDVTWIKDKKEAEKLVKEFLYS